MAYWVSKNGKVVQSSKNPGGAYHAGDWSGPMDANTAQKYTASSTSNTTGNSYLDELIAEFRAKEEEALASNEERKNQILEIFDTQLSAYESGGAFEKASLAEIDKQKVRDVGETSQSDISRGLYGIRPYGQEWESAVGAGARLKLEDLMQQRRSEVLGAEAGFLERIEEPYPD